MSSVSNILCLLCLADEGNRTYARSGVSVPGIRMVDASEGVIGIEWIDGQSIRVLLGAEDESEIVDEGVEAEGDEAPEENSGPNLSDFGLTIGKPDLTISALPALLCISSLLP